MTQSEARTRTVSWADPMTSLPADAGVSGLEFIQAMVEGRVPPPPIMATMELNLIAAEQGRAVFTGEPGEFLYNPIGTVHAGFAMTLLDSAMGCAVHTTLAAGDRYTTLETKVNFVRPITVDTGRVRCEGVVVHRGGTVATAEGKLFADKTGKLLAHGMTTCLVIPR
jgi:uncharacterized protein (TIGR00369 family)